jgi:hypothetical protein
VRIHVCTAGRKARPPSAGDPWNVATHETY